MSITRTTKKEVGKYVAIAGELRREKGLSQREVADRLGVSRASYSAFERGSHDLHLDEKEKLADVLDVPMTVILNNLDPDSKKYQQMLFEFLRNDLTKEKDGKVPKTKLAKLLYLADFGWYHENLKSMSGMQYRKIAYGPVPDKYFHIIDELYKKGKLDMESKDSAILISPTKDGEQEPTDKLSTKEKKFIAKIAKKWKNRNTQDIVGFTHNQMPYRFSEEGEIIPYELIIQEDPGYAY